MPDASLDDAIVDPVTYATPGAYDDIFKALRRDDPVHWTEPQGFRPFWTVSKYNDIIEIERRSDKFLNAPRVTLMPAADEERIKASAGPVKTLVNMDGLDHRAHRNITQSWFLPSNLRKLDTSVGLLATEFVDKLEALGGHCDFVKDVAVWYPLRVIMTILGVPREDDQKMLTLTQAVFGFDDPEMTGSQRRGLEARQEAFRELFKYFAAVSADRRKNPTSDLATVIANAEVDGQPISDVAALSYYLLVATAGHDTTSSSTAGGLLALLQHPDQLTQLRKNPDQLPGAIEEIIRWVSPVKHFFRTATEDYVLHGRQIKAGDSLMMCYPSGNRDEEVFDDPFSFKIDRLPNKHIAFGFGAHMCLGLNLARLEMKALYHELLSRLDGIELAGSPDWIKANFVGGLKKLPVKYTMRKVSA